MVRLPGIGLGRCRHRHLMETHHVIKLFHIKRTVFLLFLHGKMHGNAEIHLLRGLERDMLPVPNDIARKKKVQTGIGEEVISAYVHKLRNFFYLFPRIRFQNICSIKSLLREIGKFLIESVQRPTLFGSFQFFMKSIRKKTAGDSLPVRLFLCSEFCRGSCEKGKPLRNLLFSLTERKVLCRKAGEVVIRKILLHLPEHLVNALFTDFFPNTLPEMTKQSALFPIQNIGSCHLIVSILHQGFFYGILYLLHGYTKFIVQGSLYFL